MRHASRSEHRPTGTQIRGGVAAAAFGIALLLAASPVAADSKSGTTGTYSVTDTGGSPGVTCNYTADFPNHYLQSFSVRGPSVKWPSSSSSTSGTVGWWATVQRYTSHWVTVKVGAHATATASKTVAATFAKTTVKYSTGTASDYRVVVHIAWYTPTSTLLGSASHNVAHYREFFPHWSLNTSGSCNGRLTILT
jgi:hypothetical protein